MTIEQVRELAHAEPFAPFVIHLSDGRQILVAHQDFISVSQTGRLLHVFHGEGRSSFVDVPLIASLELRSVGAPVSMTA